MQKLPAEVSYRFRWTTILSFDGRLVIWRFATCRETVSRRLKKRIILPKVSNQLEPRWRPGTFHWSPQSLTMCLSWVQTCFRSPVEDSRVWAGFYAWFLLVPTASPSVFSFQFITVVHHRIAPDWFDQTLLCSAQPGPGSLGSPVQKGGQEQQRLMLQLDTVSPLLNCRVRRGCMCCALGVRKLR